MAEFLVTCMAGVGDSIHVLAESLSNDINVMGERALLSGRPRESLRSYRRSLTDIPKHL